MKMAMLVMRKIGESIIKASIETAMSEVLFKK
jgi:hypothetical protein